MKKDVKYVANKVPQITFMFWVIKLWSTGTGEATSDFLGDHNIIIAALLGVGTTIFALYLQLKQKHYKAPYYWFVVGIIAVSGTMIADAIHDALSISYIITTAGFGLITAYLFYTWHKSEGTLSIHSINTRRRELYYWLTVFFSFALGTAAGDMTAQTLHLGLFASIIIFSAIMLIPLGLWRLGVNPIFTFWFAYVDTRPIGASFADWFSKPRSITGLNFGDGRTASIGIIIFIVLVIGITMAKHGLQDDHPEARLKNRSKGS
jgi:uncharacterized membrane-anchored protein